MNGLPHDVRDKKLENDMTQVRAELVESKVELKRLQAKVTALTALAERDRRSLADA